MDFGIALPTAADNYKVVQRAEELGFTHAWFYDTQMLSADCFVAMGAAAVHTKRIRLGTGVKEVQAMQAAWRDAGHAMSDLYTTAFALGCVLQDGEPADSERAMAQAGPRAAVMLHRAADEALAGLKPGVAMLSTPEIDGY